MQGASSKRCLWGVHHLLQTFPKGLSTNEWTLPALWAVMWKVKLVPREMNHSRENPSGQAWSQAFCRLLQKRIVTRWPLSWWTAFPSHAQDLSAVALALLALDGGQSDGWHHSPAPLLPWNKKSDFSSTTVLWVRIFGGKDIFPLGSAPTQMKLWELMTSGKHLGVWKGGSSERARAQHSLRETLLGCTRQEDKSLPQNRQAQQVSWSEQELLTCLSICPSMLSIPPAGPELQPLLL